MDQRIIDLYDEYTHKPLTREEFLRRLAVLTGSMTAALAILPGIEVNMAHAATVPMQDDRITAEKITYQGDGTMMNAYVAMPKVSTPLGRQKLPAVMVIHENRGLNAHIEDVTRRVALAGFIGFAPDALSVFGGAPADADQARELFTKLDAQKNLNNFLRGFDHLKDMKACNGKFGCVGFCWGGALANQLAVNMPKLKAAVSFYGKQPEAVDVARIKASVMLHYAAADERINTGIPAYEAALKAAGVRYELFMYENTQHAFHNDTAPTRYNEAAAKLAWGRTIDFFNKELK